MCDLLPLPTKVDLLDSLNISYYEFRYVLVLIRNHKLGGPTRQEIVTQSNLTDERVGVVLLFLSLLKRIRRDTLGRYQFIPVNFLEVTDQGDYHSFFREHWELFRYR